MSPYSTTGASADEQREYDRLRDSLNRVPLPKNYKVNDSAKGIGKEGRQTLAIISKCARFSETGLKVLAVLQPVSEDSNVVTLQKEDLQKLFTVFAAQINFVQGEFELITNVLISNSKISLFAFFLQVFMISALKSSYKDVVAIVPVKKLTGDDLCSMIKTVLKT